MRAPARRGWLVALVAAASMATLRPAAQEPPVLAAMQDEMRRSMTDLRMKGEPAPYYIAYEVLDRTIGSVSGRLGAIVETPPRRTRTLRVDVRVGGYAFDNSRFVAQGMGGGAAETVLAPLDEDYDAMRREIWLATDAAYKRAVTLFARKTAAFQNRTSSDPVPDFSSESPVRITVPPPAAGGQTRGALERVRESSAVFAAYPDVDLSEVAITGMHGTRYFLNSEGARTVTPVGAAMLAMFAESHAADGMPIRRTFSAVEPAVSDLPAAAELAARAQALSRGVTDERSAPVGEEFAGAVLIEGVASAQFVAETLVPMMQARRPPDTENPRMAQAAPSPFLNRTGLRVMADAFTVRDTPSLTEFEGRPVPGSYVVDDEGVRASDVTLVDRGRLVTLLTNRTPQKAFRRSNGHGRSGTVLAGVVEVESAQAVPAAELKQKYLALLRVQEKSFGYIVRGVRPDGQGADGIGIDHVVRVTPDGRETPVRGLRFGAVAPMAFRDLAEASRERVLYSYRGGATSVVSVIAPSLIFEELELQRIPDVLQTPPVVPSPLKTLNLR